LEQRLEIISETADNLNILLKIEILEFLCRLQDLKSLEFVSSKFNLISAGYFDTLNNSNQYFLFDLHYLI
jgi:hypothetical protein